MTKFFRWKTSPRLNLSYYVDFFLSMYSCVSRLCLLPVIQNAHVFQFFIQTLKITLACLYVSWAIVFCRKKYYLSFGYFTPHFQNNEFQDTLWFTLLISKLWFGLIKWLIQNKNDETFFHS